MMMATDITPSEISCFLLGVNIVHHLALVPSTKACSLVTVGAQPSARRRPFDTSHVERTYGRRPGGIGPR